MGDRAGVPLSPLVGEDAATRQSYRAPATSYPRVQALVLKICLNLNFLNFDKSVSVSRSPDSVEIADKDAIIYKLREHVNKLEEDKTNLTDQLIEVLRFEFSFVFFFSFCPVSKYFIICQQFLHG